ncbi:MAG: hypothetical protein CMN93_08315 [Synechococcus sp. CPC35]|nr:hypothetical protein [Synechococcus sp. CPC35]
MRRRSLLTLALSAGSAFGASLVGGQAGFASELRGDSPRTGPFRLELVQRQRISDGGLGLSEPSGLTLNADGTALYSVSDETRAIFRMDLNGLVSASESFPVSATGLEGIALSGDGRRLLVVQEETNAVISIDLASRRELKQSPLAAMTNYAGIAKHFPARPDNKGLEGITINSRDQHVFVVKEGRPGLLIELDPDCSTILSSRLLTAANGFSHPKIGPRKLDFSGLSYDSQRDTIWVSSDKGQCLFHYDWKRDQVLQRLDLVLNDGGKSRRVRKAEGVAVDPDRGRVYVVCDRDAELYVFKLHG